MSDQQVTTLDRTYRDPRGVLVHVTGYDRVNEQVIFTRSGYEHECMRPVWQFQQFFRRVSE
ncbi:DUF4222 domain-containing protein [Pantoea sp. YU22]|uniref:DUF4222 domain-containing protein n=1 Tax=Pantoea sp. YU22 TaxID=2497684 RepID=UPI000F888D8C|nr:DUF4222 domain-containing protein [Pantoea sp. YU22]RTY57984.1 DUF4222 domain-containing protein [Pantoea sp. YU22]